MEQINRDTCIALLHQYGNPQPIIDHSLVVNEISTYLSRELILAGEKIDHDLVNFASLLHDIDKFKTIGTGNHSKLSQDWLKKRGWHAIAEVIRKHNLQCILSSELKPRTWEEKLIYYADKRAKSDTIVNIHDRLNYLRKRYGTVYPGAMKKINDSAPLLAKMEKTIFQKIHKKPSQLKQAILNEREKYQEIKKNTKVILFDFWSTLAYNKSSPYHYNHIFSLLGIKQYPDRLSLLENGFMRKHYGTKKAALQDLINYINAKKGTYTGKDAKYLSYWYTKMLQHHSHTLFPDVIPVITRLKKKYKIGVLSNTENIGLHFARQFFRKLDYVILSCDNGLLKPEQEMFTSAAKICKVRPQQILMVGDNYQADIVGSTNAGMMAIQIKRMSEDLVYKETKVYKNCIISLHDLERVL